MCISSEVCCDAPTDPACYVKGLCEVCRFISVKQISTHLFLTCLFQGNIVEFYHNLTSTSDCLDICKSYNNTNCDWISYSRTIQLCLLLDSCSLDTSHIGFESAHVTCDYPKVNK